MRAELTPAKRPCPTAVTQSAKRKALADGRCDAETPISVNDDDDVVFIAEREADAPPLKDTTEAGCVALTAPAVRRMQPDSDIALYMRKLDSTDWLSNTDILCGRYDTRRTYGF